MSAAIRNNFLIEPSASVLQAMSAIDANRIGAVIVVDEKRHLLGVVTDGDVRRAVLSGLDLKQTVSALLERRPHTPVSASEDMSDAKRLALMQERQIRHLPILNQDEQVVDVVLLEALLTETPQRMTAVIMAGGFGKRLSPLTDDTPKPMLPVDGKPVLERLVAQLRSSGIHQVNISTHYKPERIVNHFGDGTNFDVKINYVQEDEPLGTAGALSLLAPSTEPLLVINGDILTGVDFAAMQHFHNEYNAMMTVAVREVAIQVPYGVVTVDGVEITGVEEKPSTSHFINAGIYLLNPEALNYIPRDGRRMDMPDLINAFVGDGKKVVSFPVREYWLDIGRMDDYEKAQIDVAEGKIKCS